MYFFEALCTDFNTFSRWQFSPLQIGVFPYGFGWVIMASKEDALAADRGAFFT